MLVPLRISQARCCPLSSLKQARPSQTNMTMRPAAGAVNASVGKRKICALHGLQSARSRRSSSRRTFDRASGYWGVGAGSAARREEKGHEAGGLRTYFEALVIYKRYVHFQAPKSLTESLLSSDDRSCSHASPHAFASKLSRNTTISPQLSQPIGTTMRLPSSVFDS